MFSFFLLLFFFLNEAYFSIFLFSGTDKAALKRETFPPLNCWNLFAKASHPHFVANTMSFDGIPYTLRTILEPLKCASKDAIFFPLSVNPPGNFLHEAGKLPVLSISLTSCKYQDSWWDAGSFPILRWCDYSDLSEFESRLQFSEKMLNYKGLGWMPSKII